VRIGGELAALAAVIVAEKVEAPGIEPAEEHHPRRGPAVGRGRRQRHRLRLWRQRLARHEKSGLTAAAFCRQERVSISLWTYWRRRIEQASLEAQLRSAPQRQIEAFQSVETIPRRSVLVRFPSGATMEIPDDRVDC
jgi:hypothetical protein